VSNDSISDPKERTIESLAVLVIATVDIKKMIYKILVSGKAVGPATRKLVDAAKQAEEIVKVLEEFYAN